MDKIKEEIDFYYNKYLEENQDYEMQKVNNEEVMSAISNVKKCKNLPNSVPKRRFKKHMWMYFVGQLEYCLM